MSIEDSEMIPPCAINHVYVPLVIDESVLNKGPPDCIESTPGHSVKLFYALLMPLVQMLDDTEQPASMMIIRRELSVVLVGDNKISSRVRFAGRREVHCGDFNTMLCEIWPKVLPVTVVLILEEQDRVDNVPSQQQRLICRNCGGDAAEP